MKLLKRHDVVELPAKRGKGSHVMVERTDADGVRRSCPVPGHKEIATGTITSIRRKLGLSSEDGISDDEFYDVKGKSSASQPEDQSEAQPNAETEAGPDTKADATKELKPGADQPEPEPAE